MRLICPNCSAQYEVPPEAIPPTGRDVQCSACGRTWFERPPEPEPWDLVPRVLADEEEADDLAEAQAAPPPTAPPASAPRSSVTPEVAGILRAEAEREAQARAQAAVPRPVPVTDTPPPSPERPQAAPRPEEQARPAPETPRRPVRTARPAELGLDIDQINSSLRTANDRIGGRVPQVGPARRRGGFARGFWGALLVVALLAGLYVVAPTVTAALPEASVVLDPYVEAVDGARRWLDRQVGALLGAGTTAE